MAEIKKMPFTCQREGLTIRGFEFREKEAPKDGKLPAVIISHGFLSNQSTTEHYAKQFAHWGYAAFTFDFNGGGFKSTSDGSFSEMSVLTEEKDLKEVVSYVQSLAYTDNSRLILMGCSQGGVVSALTASDLKEQIHKLILFYPALCIPDDARAGKMMFYKFDPADIPDIIPGPRMFDAKMNLGSCYPSAVLDWDINEEISGYRGPVLIVHGDSDRVVHISYSRSAYKKLMEGRDPLKGDRQLVVLTGAGHGFKKKEDIAALSAVREFLHGRRKILGIDVTLTGSQVERKGLISHISLPFEGSGSTCYFSGMIQPGASDEQDYSGWKPLYCCADYILKGTDCTGAECQIHIINEKLGTGEWKPAVTTDSKALDYLNDGSCTAFLEMRKQGPVVRIYHK